MNLVVKLWPAPYAPLGDFKPQVRYRSSVPPAPEIEDEEQSDSDDSTEETIESDLNWRYNIARKFDQHNEKLNETWKSGMRLSEARVENKMLEFLLNKGKAQVQELEYSPIENDQESQSTATQIPRLVIDEANHREDHNSVLNAQIGFDRPTLSLNHGSLHTTDKSSRSASPFPSPTPKQIASSETSICPGEALTLTSPVNSRSEPQAQKVPIPQGLLENSYQILDDANRRAERATARADDLEQRLQRLEAMTARRGSQTPPSTPPGVEFPVKLGSDRSTDLRLPNAGQDDGGSSKRTTSFRKRILGRYKSSSGKSF